MAREPARSRAQRKPKETNALRILMIASEAQPFSKTGGLADVATALPKALGRLGHDVTLITPRYRGIAGGPIVDRVSLELASHRFSANLIEARTEGGARAAVDCPELWRSRRHLL
jgi:starch synthase